MSLDVSPALLEKAERGEVDEAEFVDCVRTSLPYAWEMISSLVAQLKVDGGAFADNQTPPPDEQARGQLLRALESDAIRGALQRHFGVRLAFQNCLDIMAEAGYGVEDVVHVTTVLTDARYFSSFNKVFKEDDV